MERVGQPPPPSVGSRCARWPVEVDQLYGCWRWTGDHDDDGYGIVWRGRHRVSAHLVVYETEVGPIPAGMQLDHVCRRRDCVRPEHLELVKPRENMRRRKWRNRARRGRCQAGHDLSWTGRRTPEGGIVCRTCCELP